MADNYPVSYKPVTFCWKLAQPGWPSWQPHGRRGGSSYLVKPGLSKRLLFHAEGEHLALAGCADSTDSPPTKTGSVADTEMRSLWRACNKNSLLYTQPKLEVLENRGAQPEVQACRTSGRRRGRKASLAPRSIRSRSAGCRAHKCTVSGSYVNQSAF